MTIQTTVFEKWNTRRAALGLETASSSLHYMSFHSVIHFSWVNTKILIKASPSCLDPCSFQLITHNAHAVLSIQQTQSLGWSSSPYSLFRQYTHFWGSRQLLQKNQEVILQKCTSSAPTAQRHTVPGLVLQLLQIQPLWNAQGVDVRSSAPSISPCQSAPTAPKYQWRCILYIIQCNKINFSLFHIYPPPKTLK